MYSAADIRRLFSGWISRTVISPSAQAILKDSFSIETIVPSATRRYNINLIRLQEGTP